ncbi:hypothetical protein [Burkholderia pseudomallei]|uniref:hypothetical protein n=1 Tax=Burkholderia pseudomallei TaxID=28450 RepID=UPI0005D7D26F|nr:hypothetical protein [Burkholderia pseudomallei]AJX94141.1 hypothetical protein BG24_1215 [Burkholderia pseudomallei PB08298010]MCW0080484.1 hypothetical protein [Burkholderia pseudomallei]CAJ2989463.1 putative phosphate/sulfate permease [Burkholderia pseudomallei]CAJ3394476.1 putative phosphate/sulfate permease [Burkholderia pseudomallei]CAJ7658949.1 putative phosphate/sulfate permease [Burkholderia pseudomallei]
MSRPAARPEPAQFSSETSLSPIDAAMIGVERLSALAGLLAVEDVTFAFANLSPLVQVALFGTFEAGLIEVRSALMQIAATERGARRGA